MSLLLLPDYFTGFQRGHKNKISTATYKEYLYKVCACMCVHICVCNI